MNNILLGIAIAASDYVWIGVGVIFAVCLICTICDVVRVFKIKICPSLPCKVGKDLSFKELAELFDVTYGKGKITVNEMNSEEILNKIKETLEYIDERFDCSDFVAHMLFDFYKTNINVLPPEIKEEIKKHFLSFRYWMDIPGDDSMCFFSENHTLLFSALEYLVGSEWSNETFVLSDKKGEWHSERGKERIKIWINQKFKYGFFEWYSNNYWSEDIGPLMQLISYAKDDEIKNLATRALNLMFYEIATHSVSGRFICVSSRMYSDNKNNSSHGNRLNNALMYLLYDKDEFSATAYYEETYLDVCLVACTMSALRKNAYILPQIIKDIALDKTERIIKSSNGLNPEEYKDLDLIGQKENQIIAQLSNEIFVNKGFSYNTFLYHKKNNNFASAFSEPMRFVDIFPIKQLRLMPLICNILDKNFAPTGSALTRGNVYYYRKNDYSLSTACNCHIDYCGNQHHIVNANISSDLNIFVSYPASLTRLGGAPGYWGGQRRMPASAQYKNLSMILFRMDKKHRLAENKPIFMTHALFPIEKCDEWNLYGNVITGRKGNVFFAILCNKELKFKPYNKNEAIALVTHDQSSVVINSTNKGNLNNIFTKEFDLCAYGKGYNAYAILISDAENETYPKFCARVSKAKIVQEDDYFILTLGNNDFQLNYDGDFKVDGIIMSTQFMRFDSDYLKQDSAENIILKINNISLII